MADIWKTKSMYDLPSIKAVQSSVHLFDNEKRRIIALILEYVKQYEHNGLSIEINVDKFSTEGIQMYRRERENSTGSDLWIKYTLLVHMTIKVLNITNEQMNLVRLFYSHADNTIQISHRLEFDDPYQAVEKNQYTIDRGEPTNE